MLELPSGYVKLLTWFETHVEPPTNVCVAEYMSSQILYSVLLSEASQQYKEQFIEDRSFDPRRMTTQMGLFEHEFENTPEKKRERERKAFFAAVKAERELRESQNKGEQ